MRGVGFDRGLRDDPGARSVADVFISYARSTEPQAIGVADGLRGLGYEVWGDDQLPAHRSYAEEIEERLDVAKAVVVVWSAEAPTMGTQLTRLIDRKPRPGMSCRRTASTARPCPRVGSRSRLRGMAP